MRIKLNHFVDLSLEESVGSYAFCHDNGNLPTLEGWESACSKLAHFIT